MPVITDGRRLLELITLEEFLEANRIYDLVLNG
jgi:hypothetical protein